MFTLTSFAQPVDDGLNMTSLNVRHSIFVLSRDGNQQQISHHLMIPNQHLIAHLK